MSLMNSRTVGSKLKAMKPAKGNLSTVLGPMTLITVFLYFLPLTCPVQFQKALFLSTS